MSLLSSQKIAENRPNPLKMLKQLRILWKKEVDDYTKMNVRFRRPTIHVVEMVVKLGNFAFRVL